MKTCQHVLGLLCLLMATLCWGDQERAPGTERTRIQRLIQVGRAAEAIPLAQEALKIYPKDAAVHALLGEAWFALDDFESAIAPFEEALRLSPALKSRAFNLGRSYHKVHRLPAALDVFEAMTHDSDAAQRSKGFLGCGLVLEDQGKDGEAEQAFQQAVKLDPSSHRPRYRLGLRLLQRGEAQGARDQFEWILKSRPLHHGAAFNLSLALLRMGDVVAGTAAREHHERLMTGKQQISGWKDQLQQQPKNTLLVASIAREYAALKAYQESLNWYQRLLGMEKPSNDLLLEVGQVLVAAERNKEAENILRFLVQQQPAETRAVEPLAELLMARGATEELEALRQKFPAPNSPESSKAESSKAKSSKTKASSE